MSAGDCLLELSMFPKTFFDIQPQAGLSAADLKDSSGQPININPAPWQLDLLERLNLISPSRASPVSSGSASAPPTSSPASSLVTFGGPALVDPRLLAAARLLLCHNVAELKDCGMQQLTAWDTPISAQNEALTLSLLSSCCSLLLGYFANSAAADAVLLQPGFTTSSAGGSSTQLDTAAPSRAPLPADVQMAVRFRLEKKKVLLSTVQKLSARMGMQVPGLGGKKAEGGSAPSASSKSKGFGVKK